ncbi:expressed unknown protein [Seminavis robusta]|uniref:Uncharacterized protein n=1 Tax=Seminavis robusta TaxID=568900 RepID=A0A9N8EUD5_9STRA|nr:expressed unknown protein [Seminavis robusta]|eukprot:Sro1845_g301280.1 n/a (169) ;mRNA; r:12021-12723
MGSSASKQANGPTFKEKIKASVEEEISRKMMQQREINMALNIARARDMLQIYGSIYATGVTGLLTARIAGRPVPHLAAIPVLGGGIVLGNMFDMAYGNKMARVCREAEYILENEKPRFVPFKQAPFARFYSDDDKSVFFDQATPVGDLFPSNLYSREYAPGTQPAEKK